MRFEISFVDVYFNTDANREIKNTGKTVIQGSRYPSHSEVYMKNFFLSAVIFCLNTVLAAADFSGKWEVWFSNTAEKTYLKGLSIPAEKPQQLDLTGKALDLDVFANGCDTALARNFITVDSPRTVYLGVGCKIFGLNVNGKIVYDFRSYGLGNDIEFVSVKDHIIPVELKKGRNEIRFELRRTHWRQDYCYGKDRKIRWEIAVKILDDYKPVKPRLDHPVMAYRAGNDSVTFMFVTNIPVPAAIEYRPAGSSKWLREYDTAGELILRENSRIHRIRIRDIDGWGDIEYRVVLLEPPVGRDGFKHPLWTDRIYQEILLPSATLRKAGGSDFSMFVFGDTQLSLSETCKTVAQRAEYIKKMRTFKEFQAADLLVHIGDADSYFHSIEKPLLTNLFDKFAPAAGEKLKPWLLVRGNHETNGIGAAAWFDYFQRPEDKNYYTIRYGEVLFIVLDCSDISPSNVFNAFNGPLLDTKNFIAKQARWLQKVRKSAEFRNAKFRVVLAHSEPQIERSPVSDNIRTVIGNMLEDQSEQGLIHLWIAGHVHRYWRAERNRAAVLTRQPLKLKKKAALAKAPVNWVSVDGPKSKSARPDFSYLAIDFSAARIRVRAIDEQGKCFDEFSVDQKGKMHSCFNDNSLQYYELQK